MESGTIWPSSSIDAGQFALGGLAHIAAYATVREAGQLKQQIRLHHKGAGIHQAHGRAKLVQGDHQASPAANMTLN
ncbi:hypothetical protein JOS77_15390 [Chromobacterium haemolyticum]|nr:hypothetical protein JOS77_15390 [Chromobacterium haemolyticum]